MARGRKTDEPVGPPQDCRPLDLDRSARKLIAQPSLTTKSGLEIELAEMDRAWRKYQSINDRDAVYIYLAAVFGIVMRWRLLDCAMKFRGPFAFGPIRRI